MSYKKVPAAFGHQETYYEGLFQVNAQMSSQCKALIQSLSTTRASFTHAP